MNLLAQNPDQRKLWQADLDGITPTAVEEIVRVASPVTFMRRTATGDVSVSGHDFHEGDKVVLFYRSEEHTSELQSLMRISYAVFCLKKKKKRHNRRPHMYRQL